ncbi:carboxypeptidase regulatory-like domain-containing protein [Gemmiger formicilis]|uniref:carboxypeptidase regulatory-like domain-containing protein n=1 Tax=Gemmiger formicilis TaxID=745368 RepID=UPI003FD7CAD4
MRNKRILQRGLALLLAGGMALSNIGAVPVLAEEYGTAPETVQATPETAAEKVPAGALSETETPLPEADLAEESPAAETTAAQEITVLADESAAAAVMAKAAPADPDVKAGASIDFANVANLNDDLNGWTYANGAGTTELVTDAEMGQVLKMSRTSDGGETALIYDGLNISESDTRYVTVTAEMKLDKNGYAHQYSIPYIFNNSGAVAYSLFTNDSATKYQSHVNGKNVTDAGTLATGTWQTVRMDIDIQSDTFSVSVDGMTTLRNVKARTATDNLQKIKFYADSWNRGTLYIKSVDVAASNIDPFAPHTTAATYYVSPNGDDSNDGKTEQTAWKTIARVNQDTYIPGDKILFERGGEWTGKTLAPQGSGSAAAYITIGAYGDEAKHMPRISANGKVADALYLYNQQYWEICDLDISNNVEGTKMVAGETNPTGNVTERNNEEGSKLGDYRGIHIAGRDVPTLQGYYIHDVRVHDVSGIVSWIGNTGKYEPGIGNNYGYDASKRTGGILIEAIAPTGNTSINGQPTVFSNITIEDSEFVNNSFCGITIKQYNNGKNQNNGAGWANRYGSGGAPDYSNPNWHPHTNIVIRNNYINQGASAYACNGMYLCGVKDSVVEKNLLVNIGTCGIELFFADNVAVQYNDISNVRWKGGGQDANAIDPDWRASNILIQYNYIHDCGEGLLLCGMSYNSGTIRYNLIQDCTSSYIHYSMGGGYFQINNNVFYRSKDGYGTSNFDPWGGGTASYVNNIFYDGKRTGFNFSGGTSFSYKNNAYYGTPACNKDSNPIILTEDPFEGTAPTMSRVGSTATGALLEANGLIPKTSSGLVASGADKDANGIALTDGLNGKGSKLNYTSLIAAYGDIVPIAATAYPVFEKTGAEATLSTTYTQTAASATAPTIGLFEVSMPEDAVYLRGTVSDNVNACANAKVTVTVGGKTIETTTNDSGVFSITKGLTAGEATITVTVEGRDTYTKTITLESGKVNTVEIAVPMPAMPAAYSDTLISEAFDENAGALAFNTKATVADGRLALSPGNAASSYADFDEEVQSRTAVDFSFDFQYQNGTNKGGFQFRDSDGRLLFAMCVKTADGGNTMRTPAAASLVGGTQMSEPKWVDHTADYNKTYVVRVHADFEAGTVSYQLKDKATDKVVLQELNIPTNAKNLARMYSSNWYQAKTQYIDNFVLTARSNEPEPVVVDKTALQKAIDANTGKVETDYTAETWADFATALANANAVLADENATQNDVDAAAKALTDASAALKVKPTEEPKPTVETKVFTDDLSVQNIPDALKKVGYDTPEKITEKLKLESSKKLSSDNIVVYEVKLQVSTDGVNWVDATAENFPQNGLEISFTLPSGITDETAAQYDFVISHMKDSGEVELLTPALKDGKLVVTVSSLSPFGISWKLKEQPKPSEEPKPTQAPTAPTAAPAASDASSNSSNSSGTSSPPAATAAPKATAAPTAQATVIPQTADSFPLVLLAALALCSAAALTGLVIFRKKKH